MIDRAIENVSRQKAAFRVRWTVAGRRLGTLQDAITIRSA